MEKQIMQLYLDYLIAKHGTENVAKELTAEYLLDLLFRNNLKNNVRGFGNGDFRCELTHRRIHFPTQARGFEHYVEDIEIYPNRFSEKARLIPIFSENNIYSPGNVIWVCKSVENLFHGQPIRDYYELANHLLAFFKKRELSRKFQQPQKINRHVFEFWKLESELYQLHYHSDKGYFDDTTFNHEFFNVTLDKNEIEGASELLDFIAKIKGVSGIQREISYRIDKRNEEMEEEEDRRYNEAKWSYTKEANRDFNNEMDDMYDIKKDE